MRNETLEDLIERRWRELGWDGREPIVERLTFWEWIEEYSGALACFCLALACLVYAISLIAAMVAHG